MMKRMIILMMIKQMTITFRRKRNKRKKESKCKKNVLKAEKNSE